MYVCLDCISKAHACLHFLHRKLRIKCSKSNRKGSSLHSSSSYIQYFDNVSPTLYCRLCNRETCLTNRALWWEGKRKNTIHLALNNTTTLTFFFGSCGMRGSHGAHSTFLHKLQRTVIQKTPDSLEVDRSTSPHSIFCIPTRFTGFQQQRQQQQQRARLRLDSRATTRKMFHCKRSRQGYAVRAEETRAPKAAEGLSQRVALARRYFSRAV